MGLVQFTASKMDAPLVQTAVEVLGRATSNSEVLTLNLTALIILGILKVAVVAFGLSGGSLLSSTNRSFQGRSTPAAPGVSSSDMTGGLCFLLFTSGEAQKIAAFRGRRVSRQSQRRIFSWLPRCGGKCTPSSMLCPTLTNTPSWSRRCTQLSGLVKRVTAVINLPGDARKDNVA